MVHHIVPLNALVNARRLQDIDDWGKGLLGHDGGVMWEVSDDRGLHEKSFSGNHLCSEIKEADPISSCSNSWHIMSNFNFVKSFFINGSLRFSF